MRTSTSLPLPASHRRMLFGLAALLPAALIGAAPLAAQCTNTVTANIVAFDQPLFYNRLGAFDPAAMIYALRMDVVPIDSAQGIVPGNVRLRDGKRPRPIVLRVDVGDCIHIHLTNLLSPTPADDEQPATRTASVHVVGMQLVNSITDDGSNVGTNPTSGLVAPGGQADYTYYAEREGGHMLYSAAATTGGEGDGGSIARGLFGVVTVEPTGAEWYRSQVTHEDMALATVGTTPAGQPILNYDAVYPAGHPLAGRPILKLTNASNEIVHTDINAIITGPGRGFFPEGTYPSDSVLRNRNEPFREFTVVFHDEIGITQAFKAFSDPQLEYTLHSGRDAFAINYGSSGIGAEILANRFGVGPMANCNECKFEEFFLSSWVIGDPAQVVDIPANVDADNDGRPDPGPKATKVLYPADPANVVHSYIGDHVKFRNLHMGPKEHHIFHLHAHQWVNTPDADESTYLDSQAIGPGSSYTYDIAWDGSGNRPKTPGDAIFHCHFYPHFAQGMWELWRNHDVFEAGTELDANGVPVPGARALPDGEIAAGSPIPAIVPLPGKAMPPMPTDSFPGYPFYIAGVAGHRPSHPPLDTPWDGGLPRHVVVGGTADFPAVNSLDFHKTNITLIADSLPEAGTPLEREAMAFHAMRQHDTFAEPADGSLSPIPAEFITNGRPPVPGAPFADPCVTDNGQPADADSINYKAADIQLNMIMNKAGWHYMQARMLALWQDVAGFISGAKPPEPLFFRANTNQCITFELTNLVPNEYEMDDFQVRTPTDVIGQHIHLVKFDVTSSDGAANGYNYEDGAFGPQEVRERIAAIRRENECAATDPRDGTFECPVAKQHPFFTDPQYLGAQVNVQRWFADNVPDTAGHDRTLRTVFTHDHMSPSTHQQTGLYAGLVVEPAGSQWVNNETGAPLNTRRGGLLDWTQDGGPTSWQAVIKTPNADSSYREFNLEIADYALAYKADATTFPDPANAINPPARKDVGLPFLLERPDVCPNGDAPPCPELVSSHDPGTMVVNYRNEPIALRVRDPQTNTQADQESEFGDLSYAYKSVDRADPRLNVQPGFYPALTSDLLPTDPFTPMLRAFEGDHVQYRILVGAHEEGHNFNVHGVRWLFEPSYTNSGYRNDQMMGISEHFEFNIPALPALSRKSNVDFLYEAGSSVDDRWNGMWGLMRVYKNTAKNLQYLPNNPDGKAGGSTSTTLSSSSTTTMVTELADAPSPTSGGTNTNFCPAGAPLRTFNVTAVLARDVLPGGTLVYNDRTNQGGKLHDPTAIMYVRTGDLNAQGMLKSGVPVEPLILRAAAGDCIQLTLRNGLPSFGTPMPNLDGFNMLPMIVDHFNANQIQPSRRVGLHPQLVSFDIDRSDGAVVGTNSEQLVDPGKSRVYTWYAGIITTQPDGSTQAVPAEFGATNLMSSDPILHSSKGAVGALIIEPQGATWVEDADMRAAATVTKADGSTFRDFTIILQTDLNLRRGAGDGTAVANLGTAVDSTHPVEDLGGVDDAEDSGQNGINYRTEPMWKRMGYEPDLPFTLTRGFDYSDVLTNAKVGGSDPVTPVFTAHAGDAVRFHILEPGGHQRNSAIQIHGHVFEQEPYVNNSTEVGDNPLSEWKGVREGMGPGNHFDYVLQHGAGGLFMVPGDYLYRDQQSFHFDAGMWGILRVLPPDAGQSPASTQTTQQRQ